MSAERPSPIQSQPQPSWWQIPIGEIFGRVADWFHLAFRSDDKKIDWIMARFRDSQSSPSRHNVDWALRHLTSIQQNISKKCQKARPMPTHQAQTLEKIQGIIQENFQPRVSVSRGEGAVRGMSGPPQKEDSRSVTEAVKKIVAGSDRLKGEALISYFRESIQKASIGERQRIITLLLQTEGVRNRLNDSMDDFLAVLPMQLFSRFASIEALKQKYDAMHGAFQFLSPQLAETFEGKLGEAMEAAIGQTTYQQRGWSSPKEFEKAHDGLILLKELGEKWPMFRKAVDSKVQRWLFSNEDHIQKMVEKIKLREPDLQGEFVGILSTFPSGISEEVLKRIYT